MRVENQCPREEAAFLRKKLDMESAREFDDLVAALDTSSAQPLNLVEALGAKGADYSQGIVELGIQLMSKRLTAEQAVSVVRAFVQLQHPGKVEGQDYRVPPTQRFREWRRFLKPICHFVALSVVKDAERTHAIHDATSKLGVSIFQTAFRCELKREDGTTKVVNVPLGDTCV